MRITWLGTAGFKVRSGSTTILLDPFLGRRPDAEPFTPLSLGSVQAILISHGHFDHLMDVPRMARATGARVICSQAAAQTLLARGMAKDRLKVVTHDLWQNRFGPFEARAVFGTHVRFDLKLVATTLLRSARSLPELVPLFRNYPAGQVLVWRLTAQGRTLVFFGSAGALPADPAALLSPDLLLVPLQGHSRICEIGCRYVRTLNPRMVIPHHHDDFYPPLSQTVEIAPFVRGVEETCPETRVIQLGVNQSFDLE